MYAIVETCGRQIKVAVGDSIILDWVAGAPGAEVVMDKVVAVLDEGKSVFGRPYVDGAVVKAEVLSTGKMAKVLVMKHVPKKAHEKLTGHRQPSSTLKIKDIIGG